MSAAVLPHPALQGEETAVKHFMLLQSFRAADHRGIAKRLGAFPPLPMGEGWGEGKRSAHIFKMSFTTNAAYFSKMRCFSFTSRTTPLIGACKMAPSTFGTGSPIT